MRNSYKTLIATIYELICPTGQSEPSQGEDEENHSGYSTMLLNVNKKQKSQVK